MFRGRVPLLAGKKEGLDLDRRGGLHRSASSRETNQGREVHASHYHSVSPSWSPIVAIPGPSNGTRGGHDRHLCGAEMWGWNSRRGTPKTWAPNLTRKGAGVGGRPACPTPTALTPCGHELQPFRGGSVGTCGWSRSAPSRGEN